VTDRLIDDRVQTTLAKHNDPETLPLQHDHNRRGEATRLAGSSRSGFSRLDIAFDVQIAGGLTPHLVRFSAGASTRAVAFCPPLTAVSTPFRFFIKSRAALGDSINLAETCKEGSCACVFRNNANRA
jgi:hypothetical protein